MSEQAGAPKIGRFVKDSAPYWPPQPRAPEGAPNILVILFDDVGFSDFGCYGSPIATPTIDRLAANGLRYSGFHTTAMCSNHACGVAHRAQSSFRRCRLPRQF
jgi:arylsulfatase